MADPPIQSRTDPAAPSRSDADPPPPGHNEVTGTQLSPAKPHSPGEKVIALSAAGAIVTVIGLLLSTFQAPAWGLASIALCALGVIVAGIGAFLGFSSGRKNAGTAAAAITTAALIFLIFAIARQSGYGVDVDPGEVREIGDADSGN